MTDQFDGMRALRGLYSLYMPEIMQSRCEWGIPAYAWSPYVSFSPIEEIMWEEIRGANMVMYPQFPVGRYFVDFGNPVAKIAIECDGAAFHRDSGHDRQRQQEIEARGWRVYRISGAQLCQPDVTDFDDDGQEFTEPGPARALAQRIGAEHRICRHHQEKKAFGWETKTIAELMLECLDHWRELEARQTAARADERSRAHHE